MSELEEVESITEKAIALIGIYHEEQKKLNEEIRLLKEQIRVADLAFNGQLEERKQERKKFVEELENAYCEGRNSMGDSKVGVINMAPWFTSRAHAFAEGLR